MRDDTNAHEFEALLPGDREPRERLEARLRLMAERRGSCKETSASIDRFLVTRYAELRAGHRSLTRSLEELREIQTRLREQLENATAPPWFAGVFLRMHETPAGPLAEVALGTNRRLVGLGEGVSAESLATGRVVYLGHDLNAVLAVDSQASTGVGETAIVEQVLADGRLSLRDRDGQILVQSVPELSECALDAGDTVRWNRDQMLALEPVAARAPREVFVTENLQAGAQQHLGGLARQKEQVIGLFTQSLVHPEQARHYGITHGNTLLLHGPPGNGKSTMARNVGSALAAATGQDCRFASVKGAQLESEWVGVSQRNVRELFRELTRDPRPTLLFIDEVDTIGRIRGAANSQHSDKSLGTWLTEIDGGGIKREQPIGIIAATNRKDLIDQALLERLSGMDLYIGRPGLDAAREIFAIHLPPSLPYGPNGAQSEHTREAIIDLAVGALYSPNADNAIAKLRFRDGSARTVSAREVLSGRTIEQISLHARRGAFTRHATGGTPGIGVVDMEEAVAATLERLASTLSAANARAMLEDLPQDPEVVAVDPVHRRIARHRYLHRTQP